MKKGFCDVDVEKLVPAAWNYKENDDLKQAKLVENIKRNGQVENVIVRELDTGFFEVVNGNHRLKAFVEIGFEKVHVFNTGVISDAAARRLAIETNETRFETNTVKLAELIAEVAAEFPVADLEITMPYSADELNNMNQLLDFDWNDGSQAKEPKSDSNEKKITVVTTPDKYDEIKEAILSITSQFKEYVKVK